MRITDTGGIPAPYGTGNYAVVTGLSQATACSGGLCSYTDTQTALTSYTVPAFWLNPTAYWAPKLNLWPGGVVLSPTVNTDFNVANHPVAYTDLYSSPQVYITPVGGAFPQVFASHCAHGTGFGGYVWPVCLGSYYPQIQNRIMAGLSAGGDPSLQNVKGVLNLGSNAAANGPTHLITLFDRYPDKTAAYGAGRAPNDAGDTFLGIDSVGTNSNVGLSLGSYYSISHYIGNNGDGSNWKERLTAALKEYKVPAQFDSTVTIEGLNAGCLNVAANGVVGSTGSPCGGGGGAVTSVFGRTGAVVAANGDYSVSQITGAAADAAVVHNSGTETIGGAKTFSSAVVVNTGAATLLEGTKQAGTSVTLDLGYDFGLFLRSDNTLGCQLSAALGGGTCLTGGGGGVASFNGRTGAVVPAAGDYSVSQITGAAADTAVVHNTGAETIAGAKTFSNDATFNGNLNVAGNINQTGTGPTQWSGVKWTGTTVTVPSGKDYSLGVGSDNVFKCQLASGASCMPSGGGGGVTSVFGRTGAVVAATGDYTASQITGLATVATSGSYNDLSNQPTIPSASSSTPAMDGTGAAGTAATYARGDHVHPTDTSRAPLASPAFTGTPTAPTPAAGDNSTKIATTAYVQSRTLTGVPWLTCVRGSGSVTVDTTANKAKLWGVVLTFPITTTQVVYNVTTADNTANVYDLGIYDTSGNLIVHTGPIAGSTAMNPTGAHATNWAASNTLQPGKYYLAITTNCTSSCAVTVGDGSTAAATFLNGVSVSVTSGGTLNSGVTIPGDSYSWGSTLPSWWVK